MTGAPSPAQVMTGRWLPWACAAITFLSCLAWVWVTPPFQAPDEPSHYAYAEILTVTGKPPLQGQADKLPWSSAESAALDAIWFPQVRGNPGGKPPWTEEDKGRVDQLLGSPWPDDDGGGLGVDTTAGYPPLYYSLLVPAYAGAKAVGGDVIERLTAMRVISSLLTALTALFVFLFLRELLPSTPLAAPVGALGVGLLPYLGFIGSSVNNDVLAMTLSAALFYLLARSFRRGLGVGEGAAIGAVVIAGWATKPIFLGLLPGAAVGVVLLLILAYRLDRRDALRSAASLVGTGLAAGCAYLLVTRGLWARSAEPAGARQFVSGASAPDQPQKSISGFLSYAWQYWLPRLPILTDQVPEPYPLWETMFKGFIGRFGWLEYQFPAWLYWVALAWWVALLGLVARALVAGRSLLRSRLPELAVYVLMAAGVLGLVAAVGYQLRLDGAGFEQARYLFPLLPLLGALIGLAVRGAGPRLAPYVAVAVVTGTGLLNIGGLLMTVGRYYA